VLIYLFLQRFGENRYQVTLYYQQGITDPLTDCGSLLQPHQIQQMPTTDLKSAAFEIDQLNGQITVVSFLDQKCPRHQPVLDEVARVCNKYRDDQRVKGITLALHDQPNPALYQQRAAAYNLRSDNWNVLNWDSSTNSVVNCAFNLPVDCTTSLTLVLVDGSRQIRGYYQADDIEEVDRLITEIEILLVNGEDKSNRK